VYLDTGEKISVEEERRNPFYDSSLPQLIGKTISEEGKPY